MNFNKNRKEKAMNKIIKIILLCLIIAGIIVVATLGFNVGLKYSSNFQIGISIGKEFETSDIKEITDEVYKGQKVIIQKIELYKDMVQITVKETSNEQIDELISKLREKYDISEENEIMQVSYNENIRLRDIVKPYIFPVALSTVIILAYIMLFFRKLGVWKVLYKALISIIGTQAVLFSLYAVLRLPINRLTPIVSIIVYLITILAIIIKFIKEKEEKIKSEKTNN